MKVHPVITLGVMSLMVSTLQVQTVESIPSNQKNAATPKPLVLPKSQTPVTNVQPPLIFDKTVVADIDSSYSGSGQPQRTTGGDEQCLPKDPPLTALSPMTQEKEKMTTLVVTSSKANPTLWFYMPNYSAGTTIEFKLKEYQSSVRPSLQTYSLVGKKGIIPITVAQKLASGKSYVWQLRVVCNSGDPSATPVVGGEVKFLKSAALKLPQELVPRIFAYAKAGLWDDTFTTITKLAPAQRQKYLRDLLQTYGLEGFAEQEIVSVKKK